MLQKPKLLGRMITWLVELSEFNIKYRPCKHIKSLVLSYFHLELSSPLENLDSNPWVLLVDGASNIKGSEVSIILEGHQHQEPKKQSLCYSGDPGLAHH